MEPSKASSLLGLKYSRSGTKTLRVLSYLCAELVAHYEPFINFPSEHQVSQAQTVPSQGDGRSGAGETFSEVHVAGGQGLAPPCVPFHHRMEIRSSSQPCGWKLPPGSQPVIAESPLTSEQHFPRALDHGFGCCSRLPQSVRLHFQLLWTFL